MQKKQQVPKKRNKQHDLPETPADDFDFISLPETDLDSEEIYDDFDYDVALDFGFVGIGQAGCRIAESFYNLGYRRVAVIDGVKTDLDAINEEIPKLYLATEGSGKDLDVALKSIAGKEQDIWDLFKKGLGEPDYIIICTSLGGGTGAGTCVRISEIAHEYMSTTDRPPRVGVIGAMPLRSEGGKASINSKKTFSKIKSKNLSPIILIDNQRINDLFRVGVGAIFQKCNEQIAQLLHVFNKLAAQDKGLVTFDRQELALLLDSGVVVFSAAPIKDYAQPSSISESIRHYLGRTALAEVDASTGTAAGCIFVGNKEVLNEVRTDHLDGGFEMLTRILKPGATVFRGVYEGGSSGLRCFTLLAGLSPPESLVSGMENPASKKAAFLGLENEH